MAVFTDASWDPWLKNAWVLQAMASLDDKRPYTELVIDWVCEAFLLHDVPVATSGGLAASWVWKAVRLNVHNCYRRGARSKLISSVFWAAISLVSTEVWLYMRHTSTLFFRCTEKYAALKWKVNFIVSSNPLCCPAIDHSPFHSHLRTNTGVGSAPCAYQEPWVDWTSEV